MHVLLASDRSARSERACSRAALLARKHKARLTALHIVDDELPATVAKRQELDSQDALRRTLAALPPAAELDLNIDVRPGQYEEAIIDRAEQLDADLVVIGRRRKDILLDLFRGGAGERIMRFGSRPSLTVKSSAHHDDMNALAAVDFSPPCRRALEFSRTLAPDARNYPGHAFDIPFRRPALGAVSRRRELRLRARNGP